MSPSIEDIASGKIQLPSGIQNLPKGQKHPSVVPNVPNLGSHQSNPI